MINGGIINTVAAAAEDCTTNNSSFPTSNLAYYKLDGDAIDSSGNGYNGTSPNVTWGVGRFGPAGVFNGTSSKISLPNSIITGAFSLSFWVNTSNITTAKAVFNFENSTYRAESFIQNGLVYFRINSSGPTYFFLQSTLGDISINTWHNITYVFPNTTVTNGCKIYIDGQEAASGTSTAGGLNLTSTAQSIGARTNNTLYWLGKIDQVRIFNTVITQGQVTELYEDEIECCTTDEVNYPVTNTAYYKLDGDATDSSGNGYNGTALNGVTWGAGKFDDAAVFDGSNDYINLGNSLTSALTNSFTVSLWLKIDTNPPVNTCPFSFQRTIWFDMFVPSNNILNVRLLNSSVGSSAVSILNPLVNGIWNNVVFVADKTNSIVKLYLNGQLQGSASWNGTKYNRGEKNVIGAYGTATTAWFPGSVDQVRIFNTAITQGQVAELYQEKQCGLIVPSENYNTVLYTGNGTAAGVANNIVGVGFKPDLVWVKSRSNGPHNGLFDVARGVGWILYSNLSNPEAKATGYHLKSFDTDGFTMEGNSNVTNLNGINYVARCWKAAGYANTFNVLENGSTTSNATAAGAGITAGSITTGWSVSANRDAGFSIVSYTGNGTAGATFGHGLNQAPELMIPKNRDEAQSWVVSADALGKSYILDLSNPNAKLLRANQYYYDWNDTTITTGSQIHTNGANDKIIAYCFHSVEGFSKIGSYDGHTSNPTFIQTGFRPAFVMIKATNFTQGWYMFDNKRGNTSGSGAPEILFADTTSIYTINNSALYMTFSDNGFQPATAFSGINGTGRSFIYVAFAAEN